MQFILHSVTPVHLRLRFNLPMLLDLINFFPISARAIDMASAFPLYDLVCEKDEPGQFLFAFNEQVDLTVAYKLGEKQVLTLIFE